MSTEEVEIIFQVIVAICLGGIIGIEREISKKPAGIRTHMFVAGAASLVVALSSIMLTTFSEVHSSVQSDPIRVIEAIIVGISFIGAGTVLKSEKDHNVYYLTTAASILFAAGIGITVGLGRPVMAVILTVIVVLVNLAVGNLEHKYLGKSRGGTDNVTDK